jgi:hypothetical protein
MRWIAVRAVKVGLAVSAAFGIAALATSGLQAIFLDAYLLALGGVLLLALVRLTRGKAAQSRPSQLELALAAMSRARSDHGKLGLARELELSFLSSLHLHVRLRPILREIAAHRLLRHYGVDLDTEPARARELVGASAWDLVRPDRPGPVDRLAVGPTPAQLREVVVDLEKI